MNAWAMLAISIALEIAGSSALKASEGFSRVWLGLLAIGLYSVCFWLLAFTFQRLPMGVVYAVWSGVGIVAIALIGVFVFRQPLSIVQWLCVVLIVLGAVGLNLATGSAETKPAGEAQPR